GALIPAVEHAHAGRGNAFAAARPPGHHALAGKGMGFCLLNNVIIGARRAQRVGRERVLIVDWDVPHGNGTQALMERDPSVRYVSLHQHPWYPATGMAEEGGRGASWGRPGSTPWRAIRSAASPWSPGTIAI